MPHSNTKSPAWQVVTNCSSIKRRVGQPIEPSLGHPSLDKLCAAWVGKIIRSKDLKAVDETYGGRTFTEALAVSDALSAELHVISAGLGLVHAKDMIPHYNLTVSTGDGSISSWLGVRGKTPADWWQCLNSKLGKPYPIYQLCKDSKGVIIALPATYLEMISAELLMMPDQMREKLIIITSLAGQKKIDPALQSRCLPYDERLDGSENYKGTRNDFPQRALKHLVTEIDFQAMSFKSVQKRVRDYMEIHVKPILPTRSKLSDLQIKELIQKNWNQYLGRREALHRFLRDIECVACEQKRFGTLWNEVKRDISLKENFS